MINENQTIAEIIKSVDRLPTLPGVAMKILQTVRNKDADLKDFAEILSTDPPLTAEVLKVVNSPAYAFSRKVVSINHAVNLMGLNAVKNLALSFSLVKSFSREGEESFDYALFWKNSLFGALTSKLLALELCPKRAEDAFLLGLLHDIGALALHQCMPEQYSLVAGEMSVNHGWRGGEKQVLGFNRMEFGGQLVKSWGLPPEVYVPIFHYHRPADLIDPPPEILSLTRILHLASLFIDFVNLKEKTIYLRLLETHAEEYGYGDALCFETIAAQAYEEAAGMFPLFEIQIDDEQNYATMLEQARNELINVSNDYMRDLLAQRKELEELKEQLTRDGLTGLKNYQALQSTLDDEIYRARRYGFPLCLLLADIDHFKKINDTYGHPAGDQVLRSVAQCLRATLRQSDTVARYGGEEFAIIMPQSSLVNAVQVAERLRNAVAALQVDHQGTNMQVTMSFGIAALSELDESKGDLVERADRALYEAKDCGRNCCQIAGA